MKGGILNLRDQRAVDEAAEGADRERRQDRHDHGHVQAGKLDLRPVRPLRQAGRDDGGQGQHRARGEVDAAGDDDHGDADGDQAHHRNLAHDIEQVAGRQKGRGQEGHGDEHAQEDQDDGILAQEGVKAIPIDAPGFGYLSRRLHTVVPWTVG